MANAKAKVAVLGAGFAGLETAFYLRHALHDKVDLTLAPTEIISFSSRTRFTSLSSRIPRSSKSISTSLCVART